MFLWVERLLIFLRMFFCLSVLYTSQTTFFSSLPLLYESLIQFGGIKRWGLPGTCFSGSKCHLISYVLLFFPLPLFFTRPWFNSEGPKASERKRCFSGSKNHSINMACCSAVCLSVIYKMAERSDVCFCLLHLPATAGSKDQKFIPSSRCLSGLNDHSILHVACLRVYKCRLEISPLPFLNGC